MTASCKAALVIVATLLLGACVAPHVAFRLCYGRGTLTAEQLERSTSIEGLTPEQVVERLGEPHVRREGGRRWVYYMDPYGMHILQVSFGPGGRVRYAWT